MERKTSAFDSVIVIATREVATSGRSSSQVRLENGGEVLCDPGNVFPRHCREERQRQNVSTRPLGDWEITVLPTETAIDGEEMDGRIVNPGADARCLQLAHHVRAANRQ